MLTRSWFDALKSRFTRSLNRQERRASGQRGPATRRLRLETLEDRRVLCIDAVASDPVGVEPSLGPIGPATAEVAPVVPTGQPATFAEGDWNRDGVFDQFNIMAALITDRNVAGANAASSQGNRLTAVAGEGEGIVNVSPERSEPGFSVEIQVAVWKTSPNTTFNVKRAVDFTPDGICTSSSFVQFPLPNPGPLVQLTTSEDGAGATHIKFERPQIADGASFDVRFEVSTADASIVLRTECFTVSVK